MKKLSFFTIVAGAMLLVGAGCAKTTPAQDVALEVTNPTPVVQDTSPIKIGWLGPLTGDVATVGEATRDAAVLAVKEINEAGGINGRQLELIVEDGGCDSKKANTAGNKMINVDKVVAIVGGMCSGETLAVSPMAEEQKVLMVSPASTAPSITEAGDYIFRVVPSDSFQGKYVAEFAYNTLGKRKVALLISKTDYTEGVAKAFKDSFVVLGGEVVVEDTFLQTDRDLRTQLTKVKNSDTDLIYFASFTEAALAGLKQKEELSIDLPVLAPDSFGDPKIHAAPGAEGIVYAVPKASEAETFKTKFLAETGRDDMPVYVTETYDIINILAMVMKDAGSDSGAVKQALYGLKDYQGVSKVISFDENGDLLSAEYDLFQIKEGKNVPYQM